MANRFGPFVLPTLAESVLATVLGVGYGLLTGRFRFAMGHLYAWWWNLRRLNEVRAIRARTAVLRAGSVGPEPLGQVPPHAPRSLGSCRRGGEDLRHRRCGQIG